MLRFELHVLYSQVAVFDGRLERPFNDWTDRHVRQGFSWRPGSVSFKTLIEAGPVSVEVSEVDRIALDGASLRTISVPFTSQEGSAIEIATVTESHGIGLGPGTYQVVFETGLSNGNCWCRINFVRHGNLEPQILVEDPELAPTYPLLMDAEPA
jgi:hypothetical protein